LREVELQEGGKNKKVTEANKEEYIDAIIKWRFGNRIKPHMGHIKKGLFEVIPKNMLSIFDPNELELLVCGLPVIDIEDWQQHTLYAGRYTRSHPVTFMKRFLRVA
ncbi:unnamed protein product, partial [Gongylonema pulchrum]|uniref:HECT-type E3 ubiquitin transferase n=1 Tax=Gongylonema pulchrum TaxID=637853 RepID=A0A183DJY1_9BILA